MRIICKLPSLTPFVPTAKLDRILANEAHLQPVLAKARELRALGRLVRAFLPPDLTARVANFRDGELVLSAESSAIAAKLRLLAPTLSSYLSKSSGQVSAVSIRVQPSTSQISDVAPLENAHLSTPALEALKRLHKRLSDSPAKQAVQALLAHRGIAVSTAVRAAAPQ